MPFGASRAGLMSVAGDDIPDSDVYRYLMDSGSGDVLNSSTSGNVNANLLNGASWDSQSNAIGNFVTVYQGASSNSDSEYLETQSQIPINGSEFSVAIWLQTNGYDNFAASHALRTSGDNTTSFTENGYTIRMGDQGPELQFADNDSRTEIAASNVQPTNEMIFIAASGNGNSGSLYVWDVNNQLFAGSGSGSRNVTNDTFLQIRPRDADIYRVSATWGWSDEKTESEFSEVWEQTKDTHA